MQNTEKKIKTDRAITRPIRCHHDAEGQLHSCNTTSALFALPGLFYSAATMISGGATVSSVSSALTSYLVNACVSTIATSASTVASYTALSVGSGLLLRYFGSNVSRGILDTIQNEISRFRSTTTTSSTTSSIQSIESRKEKQIQTQGLMEQLVQSGAKITQHATVSQMVSPHSTGVVLMVLGSFLSYLHYLGASDVRGKLEIRHQKKLLDPRKKPAIEIGQTNQNNNNSNYLIYVKGIDPEKQKAYKKWYADRIKDAQKLENVSIIQNAQASNVEKTTDDYIYNMDNNNNDEDNDDHLTRILRQKYLSAPYYNPEANMKMRSYFKGKPDPVRIIVNMLLGFVLQTNSLIGGFDLGETDALPVVSKIISLMAYWEVFVYALRLYGWGPTYTAFRYVSSLLLKRWR